ncbi:hypothetical protein F4782DRAFT_533543 [Xylaria castorea]|nr:hypothetical protein F4782DRAFT_533543 [Xylaria castorea]
MPPGVAISATLIQLVPANNIYPPPALDSSDSDEKDDKVAKAISKMTVSHIEEAFIVSPLPIFESVGDRNSPRERSPAPEIAHVPLNRQYMTH